MSHEFSALLYDIKRNTWVAVSVVGSLVCFAMTVIVLVSDWYLITLIEENRCLCSLLTHDGKQDGNQQINNQTVSIESARHRVLKSKDVGPQNNQCVIIEKPLDRNDVLLEVTNKLLSGNRGANELQRHPGTN